MYEKFVALAFVFAVAVDAKDHYFKPAPLPGFSTDPKFYTYITTPSNRDFGDFANNVSYAGFALWDDTENTKLQDWIDSIDWTAVDFPKPNF